jgi:carbamate kinase
VDAADPAFSKPSKPIGPFYTKERIDQRVAQDGWQVIEVRGKGYRRVVPSPKPLEIMELELIHHLFDEDRVVVCCGGGGVPVIRMPDGRIEGVEAVIDKDLTASQLAVGTQADTLAILTDVEKVCLDYGTEKQREVDRMTVTEARAHLEAGQFPGGSMGPKIEACIRYVEQCKLHDALALITSIDGFTDALAGRTGTRIVSDR